MQLHVINFVNDFKQVGAFLQVINFLTTKTDRKKVALNHHKSKQMKNRTTEKPKMS
jgi:hypothetical protein